MDPFLLHDIHSLPGSVSEMVLDFGTKEDRGFEQINPLTRSMAMLLEFWRRSPHYEVKLVLATNNHL